MQVKVTFWDPTVQAFLASMPPRRRATWLALAAAYWMRTQEGQVTAQRMAGEGPEKFRGLEHPEVRQPRERRSRSLRQQPNHVALHSTPWDDAATPPKEDES
jgi:hypothetical protein